MDLLIKTENGWIHNYEAFGDDRICFICGEEDTEHINIKNRLEVARTVGVLPDSPNMQ